LVLGRHDQVHRIGFCESDAPEPTPQLALRYAQYPAPWDEAGSEAGRGEARIEHMHERLWHQLIAAVRNRRHEARSCQGCEFPGYT